MNSSEQKDDRPTSEVLDSAGETAGDEREDSVAPDAEPQVSALDVSSPDRVGTAAGVVALFAVGLPLMILSQRTFGLWEPWETVWAEVANQMRDNGSWFHPTLSGQSAPRGLLPIWLVALAQSVTGPSELAMRLPSAVLMTSGCAAIFAWLRGIVGGTRALLAAFAALLSPAVFLAGTTLAGNGVWIGAMAATVALFGALVARPAGARDRVLLGLGALLVVDVLARGLWGLWVPLLVFAAFAMATRPAEKWGRPELAAALAALTATLTAIALGLTLDWEGVAVESISLWLPMVVVASMAIIARQSEAVRLWRCRMGAVALILPVATATALALLYHSTGPEDPLGVGPTALSALTESPLLDSKSLAHHVPFDFWVRQLGFAAYPWTALLPLGLVYLLRETDRETDSPEAGMRKLLAQWFVVCLLTSLLLGTVHEVYLYPAAASIAVAVALAMSDDELWKWLRARRVLLRVLGTTAVFAVLFLSKDLERYPKELLGALLTDGKVEFPEAFNFGRALKFFRNTLALLVLVWCTEALGWPARLWRWRLRRKRGAESAQTESLPVPTILSKASALTERPIWIAVSVALVSFGFAVTAGLSWVPGLSQHLSQRGLLETYDAHKKEGETLATYQVSSHKASFYFSSVETLPTLTALKDRFSSSERAFVVLPRNRLANLNFEVRKGTKPRRNIHILDDRSSRYLLASNVLLETEQERSRVAQAILSERPKPVYQITPKNEKNERQFPQFDKKIQLLGYEVYHHSEVDEWGNPKPSAVEGLLATKKAAQLPTFKAGEKLVIRYYFKVLRRITSSQKIFLHMDTPGNRINGDHVPVNEEFSTNYWVSGDYIVDTQFLDIEAGSRAGVYTMYMGFFLGSKRMAVTPTKGHDGSNRVKLGQINVENF